MMNQMLVEMVHEAAKEIGFKPCEENVEQVTEDLKDQYGVEIEEDAPVTWQVAHLVAEVVQEWQEKTAELYI